MEARTDMTARLLDYFYGARELYPFWVSVFFFIFGSTGNVIIIIIITCNKDMRNVPNMYMFNLAISDIIYLTVHFFFSLEIRFPVFWMEGEIFCLIFSFCERMSISLSAYSVAVLSIQRYRITADPLQAFTSSQPTWRGTGGTICGLWIVSSLITIPAVRSIDNCHISIFLLLINYYQLLSIFNLLVSCVFPVCVTAFCYIMTARHLLKSSRSVPGEIQNPQQNTRKVTAKIVLGLAVIFVISFVPYHILHIYLYSRLNFVGLPMMFLLKGESEWLINTLDTMMILNYFVPLNSCLCPVALFCTSSAFRTHLKRYLTCCCCKKNPLLLTSVSNLQEETEIVTIAIIFFSYN
jgi:hypothetical protein